MNWQFFHCQPVLGIFLSWRMSSRQLETVCQRSETPWLGESVKIHIEGTISVRSQQFVLSLSWWSKMNISSRILNRTTCLARAEEWALVHTVLSPGVSVDQRTLGGPCGFMGSGSGRGAAEAVRIQAVLLLGGRRLPQREMLVHAACPGVRQPEGSSRRSISLIKSKRPCARLLYWLFRNYCEPPGANL